MYKESKLKEKNKVGILHLLNPCNNHPEWRRPLGICLFLGLSAGFYGMNMVMNEQTNKQTNKQTKTNMQQTQQETKNIKYIIQILTAHEENGRNLLSPRWNSTLAYYSPRPIEPRWIIVGQCWIFMMFYHSLNKRAVNIVSYTPFIDFFSLYRTKKSGKYAIEFQFGSCDSFFESQGNIIQITHTWISFQTWTLSKIIHVMWPFLTNQMTWIYDGVYNGFYFILSIFALYEFLFCYLNYTYYNKLIMKYYCYGVWHFQSQIYITINKNTFWIAHCKKLRC